MSIYYAKRIRETDQLDYVTEGVFAGAVACQSTERHKKGRGYYAPEVPTPAATGVFIEWHNNDRDRIDYVTFLCPTHGGPVKSRITRAGRYRDDAEFAEGVAPSTVALNVAGWIATVEQARAYEKEAQRIRAEEEMLAHRREHWSSKRADYNSVADIEKATKQATLTKPDDFGRVFVTFGGVRLTANEAAAVGDSLMRLSSTARDQTAVAVKP